MKGKKFRKDDLDAFLIGLSILGTGGGGDPDWGKKIIENDMGRGREYILVDPQDVEDDAFVCSGGIMGSVKFLDGASYEDIIAQWEDDFTLVRAMKKMEEIKGKKLDYIIPFEPGGLNAPVVMSAAARMGIPVIDGDGVGRAAPETHMSSFLGHGISLNPMPLVDYQGNAIVILDSNEPTYADEIGRFVVTKGGGLGGNSHYAMTGKELKTSCVPNSMSMAIKIGKNIIKKKKKGTDIVKGFADFMNGKVMIKGVLEEVDGEDKGGFYLTNITLKGQDDYEGKVAKMVIKNEVMALWIDGEIKCIFPDYVFLLDPVTGEGIMSTDLKPGIDIALVSCSCHEKVQKTLKSEIGKKAFGGGRFGYPELKYVPFQELNK